MELIRKKPINLIAAITTGGFAGLLSIAILIISTKWALAFLAGALLVAIGVFYQDRHKYLLILLALSFPFALMSVTLFERLYFGTPGINIGIIEVLLFFLYLSWIIRGSFYADISKFAFSTPNILALFYISAASISFFGADDKALWFFGIIALFKAYLLFVYIANNFTQVKHVDAIVTFLMIGCILQSTLGIVQYLTKSPIGLSLFGESSEVMMMSFGGQSFPRIAGTLLHPNQLSNFLGLQIPIALSFLLTAKRSSLKNILYATCLLFGVVTFLFTFSRTGWFNLTASTSVVLLLAIITKKFNKNAWIFLFVLGAAASIVLLLFAENIFLRLTQSNPILVTSRYDMVSVAWQMIYSSPIFGIGINNYVHILPSFSLKVMNAPVHNLYFLIAAETGLFGLITWLIFVISQVKKGWRQIFSNEPVVSALTIGLIGGIIGFLVDGIADFSYILPSTFYLFWAFMGMFIAVNQMKHEEDYT